jgi:phage terminase Nu1 subunit (DNA packaging protein)
MTEIAPLQSKQQIAVWAGVSPRTVQYWALRDGCPHFRIGRVVRFELAAVREWLATRPEPAPTPRTLRVPRLQVAR